MRGSKLYLASLCVASLAYGSVDAVTSSAAWTAQSSASATIKSGLKSTSGSTSSTTGSTSGKEPNQIDKHIFTLIGNKDPRMYLAELKRGTPEQDSIDALPETHREWLGSILEQYSAFVPEGMKIRVMEHRRLDRKGDGACLLGNTLVIKPEALNKQNSDPIRLALLRSAWDRMSDDDQRTWKLLAGWDAHPVLPFIDTKKRDALSRRAACASEDFAREVMSVMETGGGEGLRALFALQAAGSEPARGKEVRANIYFAFISEDGMAGSSQGHSALVIEDETGRRSVIDYAAAFDWSHPVRDGARALVGAMPRLFEAHDWDTFTRLYVNEGREVTLYDLKLNDEQKSRLLLRVHELYGMDGDYSFLRQNCANPLRDLISAAVPGERQGLHRWHTPKTLKEWIVNRS